MEVKLTSRLAHAYILLIEAGERALAEKKLTDTQPGQQEESRADDQ